MLWMQIRAFCIIKSGHGKVEGFLEYLLLMMRTEGSMRITMIHKDCGSQVQVTVPPCFETGLQIQQINSGYSR